MLRALVVILVLASVALAVNPQAKQLLGQVQQLSLEAEKAYPQAFPDLPLWKQAIEVAQKATQLEPDAPETWEVLARVYSRTGWWIRAEEAWHRFIALGGEGGADSLTEAYMGLGYAALQRGAIHEAIAHYRQATRTDPKDAETWVWLGRAYLRAGDPVQALPAWREAERLSPSPRNHYFAVQVQKMTRYGAAAVIDFYQGYTAYEQQRLPQALKFFSDAQAQAPGWTEAHRWVARILLELDQSKKAVAAWTQVIVLAGKNPADTHFLKLAKESETYGFLAAKSFFAGIAAYQAGRLDAARLDFEQAGRANPKYAKAWRWLGRTDYELSRFREAVAAYQEVLKLDPLDAGSAYFLKLARRAMENSP